MLNMKIPEEIIALLEAHLEPKEAVRAINALNDLVHELIRRAHSRQIADLEENLKLWMGAKLATKSDLETLRLEIKDDLRELRETLEKIKRSCGGP